MMSNLWRNSVSGLLVVSLFGMLAPSLIAQTAEKGVLTGRVTDPSGGAVTSASVTATSINSGQRQTANAGPDGTYKLELPAGNYRLTFEAAGFNTLEISSATVSGTAPHVVDGTLENGEPVDGKLTTTQQENLPNAPSTSTTAPSLSDLGISPQQTQG